MKKYLFIGNLFLLYILLFSNSAYAVKCTWSPLGSRPQTKITTVPVQRSHMTLPPTMPPPGTILYRQRMGVSHIQEISCKDIGTFYIKYWIWSYGYPRNSLYTSAYVFKTAIPGLDVYFELAGMPMDSPDSGGVNPAVHIPYYQGTPADTIYRLTPQPDIELVYIWTGVSDRPVAYPPVGTITRFPSLGIYVEPYYRGYTGTFTQADNVLYRIEPVGSMVFTTPTCNTPDVTVNLGDHKIGRFISGEVTEMGRKAFNLALNCPINYGYGKFNPSNSEKYIWNDTLGTVQQTPTIENGDMTISFSAFDTLDTDRWIAKANPSDQSDSSKLWAEGVGVALYHSGGVRYRFDNTQSITVTPISTGGTPGIINVPLEAAFTYDTTKPVSLLKPGNVNVAIEAVIQYN